MQRARVSNHPCHRLSVPAAKRFWCRHCMMVFEDAITRWRHSRSCRSGGFDNFIRRREIETQALQKMAETLDPEMAMGPIPLPTGEAVAGCSKELCCFICRQRFMSLDEMREHVKYPCNKPANLQRPSMTVYIEEPTFGTGIQQHFTDGPGVRPSTAASGHHETTVDSSGTSSPHPVAVYMNDSEEAHAQGEAKPTNIYVNEKGETVIEVENLDLNTKSGELSLAHLLTQLSQQGIVFDQQASSGSENNLTQGEPVIQGTLQELDLSQPTAVDAANTLTQLAGSAFRAASHPQTDDIYSYAPPTKRVKSECIEVQYPSEQVDQAVETEMPKDGIEVSDAQNYIICTDESEVISVVRAGSVEHDTSQNSTAVDTAVFQGSSDDDASRQVYHAAQYNVASQESVGQQTASGSEPTSQTVLVKHADEDYNPVQDGEQVDEFTDSTQISVRIPPTVDHLEQLDVTSSQMSGNGSAPISLEHHDNMQPQEDPDLVSGQPEGVCKNSSMPGDSTTDVPAATFNVSNPQGSSAEQLESSVGPQSETGFLLPQIVSVSSTVPEMPVTPVQQTPSAGMLPATRQMEYCCHSCSLDFYTNRLSVSASPNTSPKALCGAQNSLNSLSSPVEVVTESSFPGKAADPAKSSRDKVTCKQGVSFNLIADPEESVEGEKEQRVTRSVSLEMAKQKTRVLRSRSLPDCTVPKKKLPRLLPVVAKEPPAFPVAHDKTKSIQEQIQLVRKDKKLCNLQRTHFRGLLGTTCNSKSGREAANEQKFCHHRPFLQPKDNTQQGVSCDDKRNHICLGDSSKVENRTCFSCSEPQRARGTAHQMTESTQKDSKYPESGHTDKSGDGIAAGVWLGKCVTKRSDKDRPCKCMACGTMFSSRQLLQKHRRVPCRVQHTRLMSQKVLRPRPAAVHKPAHKPRPKVRLEERLRPKLLMASLVLQERLKREKGKKKQKNAFYCMHREIFYPKCTEPQIRLWDKRVNVSGLGEQEQFLFEVGLVKTAHMSPDMLLRHRAVIRSKVAIHRLRHAEARAQQAALKVFVPENIVIHSESCPSSPDGYNSPPVLERMDLNVILREYEEPLASDLDPPVLEPMIDGPHVEFSQMQSLSFASVPEGRNGTQNENSESAVFVKQYYDICPELSASLLPYVSSSAEKSVVKITIKSVASGVRLAEGGEIIIKTPYNSDRILLINPQEDCEDYSPRYSPRPADLNRTGSSKESADHLFRANSNPSHSQSKCSPFVSEVSRCQDCHCQSHVALHPETSESAPQGSPAPANDRCRHFGIGDGGFQDCADCWRISQHSTFNSKDLAHLHSSEVQLKSPRMLRAVTGRDPAGCNLGSVLQPAYQKTRPDIVSRTLETVSSWCTNEDP